MRYSALSRALPKSQRAPGYVPEIWHGHRTRLACRGRGSEKSAEPAPVATAPLREFRLFSIKGCGVILVQAQVNGGPVTLMVDTGSSHTVVSQLRIPGLEAMEISLLKDPDSPATDLAP